MRNKKTMIAWIILTFVTVLMVALSIGIRNRKRENNPVDSTVPAKTTEADSGVTGVDTDIPEIVPGTESPGESDMPDLPGDGEITLDILKVTGEQEHEKNSSPHIEGEPSVIPGIKEEHS